MIPQALFAEQLRRWSVTPPGWQGWGEDRAAAIWWAQGPVEVRPLHGLGEPILLGAELRGGHGWTRGARDRLAALLLHVACDEAVLWRNLPCSAPLIVSARLPLAICDAALVEHVAAALACTGLDASLLELGLGAGPGAPAGPGELLAWSALRDMGIGLSVDAAFDASAHCLAGHASRLPYTSLRLPPSVADRVEDDPGVRCLVREAVRAARSHAASVVATGVRRAAQRDILAELGCDAAQGPLFGLPTRPAAFQAALASDALA